MTFAEICLAVQDRLNLTSSSSLDRIGRELNDRHRRITSSLGLSATRRVTVNATATLGQTTLTFTGVEKLINVVDRSVTPYRILQESSVEQIRAEEPFPNTFVSYYAIVNYGWNSVTILMDCTPQTPYVLYADAIQNASTLSGIMEPLFPESFHDVLMHGVLEDEYLKLEKVKLANDSGVKYAQRLSDLRYFFAKSSYMDWVQGATRGTLYEEGVPGAGGGASGNASPSTSYVQTGLITFDGSHRSGTTVPFAVAAGNTPISSPPFIAEGALSLSDIVTDNVGNVAHGFTPKSPNDATMWLNGLGGIWSQLTGAGITLSAIPYTPTDGSAAALTLTNLGSYYVKIGKLVWVSINVTYPVTGNGNVAAIVLPFALDANIAANLSIGECNAATPAVFCQCPKNSTLAVLRLATMAAATNAQLSAASLFMSGLFWATV